MDSAFYVLSSSDEATGVSSPDTSLSGSSHDTSSAKYHITDIAAFAADLNEAAKAAFPNRGRSRYDTVNVSLMRWEEDELGVEPELRRLDEKFQDYGFKTEVWQIPSRDSHLELMSKSIDLLRSADNDRNLFILYYAGHGRINSARQAEWICNRDPNYASVDWSAIQSLFAKARSDVLILLDTCAAASSTMRSQYGTMEAIVASGFESRAPPPGEYSFTNTLIEVLDDWINKRSFSASCLHAEILFQLKLKEAKKGREGRKLEWCTTPIHINYTADSKLPGIELCRRNTLLAASSQLPHGPRESEKRSTFTDAMDLDFDDSSTSLSPLSNLNDAGDFQTPHVLIKIGLEHNQGPLDVKQCLRWLETIPFLGKWAKIEGVYPSYSTLVVLSMPISVWDMMPDHLACSFIGYVTGPSAVIQKTMDEGPAQPIGSKPLQMDHLAAENMFAKYGLSAEPLPSGILKMDYQTMEIMLARYGVDISSLSLSQIRLFSSETIDRKMLLIELWRISPPTGFGAGASIPTTLEREEALAKMRWEQSMFEHNMSQKVGVQQSEYSDIGYSDRASSVAQSDFGSVQQPEPDRRDDSVGPPLIYNPIMSRDFSRESNDSGYDDREAQLSMEMSDPPKGPFELVFARMEPPPSLTRVAPPKERGTDLDLHLIPKTSEPASTSPLLDDPSSKPRSDSKDLPYFGPLTCSRCRARKTRCVRQTPYSVCDFCAAIGFDDCETMPDPDVKIE